MNINKEQLLNSTGKWLQSNVDFAFVLAAFTETPRWTVAFKAIHEPTWIGVPLGVLLAFATAKAWRRYFEEPDNKKLLWFNIASVVVAVLVISPVLYALAGAELKDAKTIDTIVLSEALTPFWLRLWSVLLAVTTFSPLIQLAAVTDVPKPDTKPEQQPSKRVTRTAKTTQTVELSEQVEDTPVQFSVVDPVQIEANTVQSNEKPVQIDLTSLSIEQKKVYALQALRDESVNISKLARDLGIKRRQTLYEWKAELDA
mgnify:CR=1 FL=1